MDWSPAERAEAQSLYDQGFAPGRIARRFNQRGKTPKVTYADVRPILDLHRLKIEPTAEQIAEIRRIKQTEWVSNRVIADRVGISKHIVERACTGMRPPNGVLSAFEKRTYTLQGQRNDLADDRLVRFKVPEPVEVPAWVPDHLYELYEHTARTQDEHVAARVVRELKRGNSVAFAVMAAHRVNHGAA
jgi:hypothetical protein